MDLQKLFKKLCELMEQNNGAQININYIESGAQYVNHIDHQYFGAAKPQPTAGKLPECLTSEAAQALWKKVRKANWIDDDYQPKLSRSESALLASEMAKLLGIKKMWPPFEQLWRRKNMRSDYSRALNQQKTRAFIDKVKKVLDS